MKSGKVKQMEKSDSCLRHYVKQLLCFYIYLMNVLYKATRLSCR